MKKSFYSKTLVAIFMVSLFSLPMTFLSCKSGPKYQKPRNGGKKVNSSGHVGNRKSKNSHVWGK